MNTNFIKKSLISIFFLNLSHINAHAGGMAVAQPYGFEIDLRETLFLEQLRDFSLLSSNSFLQIFEIKFHEKNTEKNLWQKFMWKIRNCPSKTKFVSRRFLFFENLFIIICPKMNEAD